jgi:uncharacterized protein YdeI (YjbR/CyaY-like superfamily)
MSSIQTIHPENAEEWRSWLLENHITEQAVWLIYSKKNNEKNVLTWSEAVDEALCFGWIDSVRKTIDEQRFIQYFSKRKKKSGWSKINKDKIVVLEAAGRMNPAGLKVIEVAKEDGSWNLLDEAEALILPEDLKAALGREPQAALFYESLSNSMKKVILMRLLLKKKAETREKFIQSIVESCAQSIRPNLT